MQWIARAVADHSEGKDLPPVSIEHFESLPGKGLVATLTGIQISAAHDASSKPELVVKLAEILQAEDMHNVQALTHARVPIVE